MQKLSLAFASALALLGCKDSDCDDLACEDQLRINIYGDNNWIDSDYNLTATTDDGTLHCFPVRQSGQGGAGGVGGLGGGNSKDTTLTHDCEGDIEWLSFDPPRLILAGTPDDVEVRLEVDDDVLGDKLMTPDYGDFNPNGEGCGSSTCQVGSVGLTLSD